jgi:DNA modification methylase
LQFAGLEGDRARSRGALADYLTKFTAPGDNAVPVDSEGEVSRNDWIEWAESSWTNIRETDTLNVKGTKDDGDTRHVCPLQLGVIRRAVKLYTNPGEIVFSPFAGIGSEVRVAVEEGRRALGIELKPSWAEVARGHCAKAEEARRQARQADLFAWAESQAGSEVPS